MVRPHAAMEAMGRLLLECVERAKAWHEKASHRAVGRSDSAWAAYRSSPGSRGLGCCDPLRHNRPGHLRDGSGARPCRCAWPWGRCCRGDPCVRVAPPRHRRRIAVDAPGALSVLRRRPRTDRHAVADLPQARHAQAGQTRGDQSAAQPACHRAKGAPARSPGDRGAPHPRRSTPGFRRRPIGGLRNPLPAADDPGPCPCRRPGYRAAQCGRAHPMTKGHAPRPGPCGTRAPVRAWARAWDLCWTEIIRLPLYLIPFGAMIFDYYY
jgi:hypothetical protein